MPKWTVEQVIALAPDPASASAGQGLANAGKWVSAGTNETALWGEAKGSGANPYQVAIDLTDVAYKCSCPSRKFPCKHSLGLLLRYARTEVPQGEPPQWTQDWLAKRTQKAEPKAPREADPESAAKRADKRWSNILRGLDECEAFLCDAVAQGLLSTHSSRSWDQMAARMVDAQAPGVARKLRQIGSVVGVGTDWGLKAAALMGEVALLAEAARNLDALDDPLKADVRSALGIATRKEDLPVDGVIDLWDVVGQVVEVEDRISTCRSWLRGRGTGRWATHLAFSAAGQPYSVRLAPGQAFAAMAQFYPSAWPLRANFEDFPLVDFQPRAGSNWEAALHANAEALARNPWLEQSPVAISFARLARHENRWFVIDQDGVSVPGTLRGDTAWRLLAMTGNVPCQIFGEFSGRELTILSAWGSWGFVAL